MTLVDLTFIQFYILALIDSGKHSGVTFDEVREALGSGTLFSWLDQRFPGEFDTSLYTGSQAAKGLAVVQALDEAAGGVDGRERKKMGVEHNGICLLAALVNEVIQRQEWIGGKNEAQ